MTKQTDYLEELAQRGSRERYEAVLAKVSDVEPELYDRLPASNLDISPQIFESDH